MQQVVGRVVEAIGKKGAWKAWVIGPHRPGFLRIGHAWKTRKGAQTALLAHLAAHNIKGYVEL